MISSFCLRRRINTSLSAEEDDDEDDERLMVDLPVRSTRSRSVLNISCNILQHKSRSQDVWYVESRKQQRWQIYIGRLTQCWIQAQKAKIHQVRERSNKCYSHVILNVKEWSMLSELIETAIIKIYLQCSILMTRQNIVFVRMKLMHTTVMNSDKERVDKRS